ncbi:Hypothetical protein NGAL_HAMBI2605_20370 [Neorhizobium galegae bv. orientalis]|nr:Hypothetical protein NGAL_HAMBI2605_20370 [Neorhizobium galegae bv. orientalis]
MDVLARQIGPPKIDAEEGAFLLHNIWALSKVTIETYVSLGKLIPNVMRGDTIFSENVICSIGPQKEYILLSFKCASYRKSAIFQCF